MGMAPRLSAFYGVYYATVGAFIPYWPLYLSQIGYSAAQIGAAFALLGLVRIATPVIWGWLMDRSGRRMPWIVGTQLISFALFSLIPGASSFTVMLVLHAAYALFWNAALPAFDVVTLNHIEGTRMDYSRIRLWGSVGFVLSVAGLGPVFDFAGLDTLPWIVGAGMLGMALLGLCIPDKGHARREDDNESSLLDVLRRPAVIALLAAAFLSQFSFAPYYSFFSIFLEGNGYARSSIGYYWALGVAAEVVVFIYAGRLIARYGARSILLLALASTALRWALLAMFVDIASMLALSQILHLSSFGLYHTASVWFVHRLFPGRLQGRGQALLAAVSFGLGGSLGSFLAGQLWESTSGQWVYAAAALSALIGWWVAWRHLHPAAMRT
jgi:PPP family 3-phenylpropionic acid transporter